MLLFAVPATAKEHEEKAEPLSGKQSSSDHFDSSAAVKGKRKTRRGARTRGRGLQGGPKGANAAASNANSESVATSGGTPRGPFLSVGHCAAFGGAKPKVSTGRRPGRFCRGLAGTCGAVLRASSPDDTSASPSLASRGAAGAAAPLSTEDAEAAATATALPSCAALASEGQWWCLTE